MKKSEKVQANDALWCIVDQQEYDLIDGNFIHELDPYIVSLIQKIFQGLPATALFVVNT